MKRALIANQEQREALQRDLTTTTTLGKNATDSSDTNSKKKRAALLLQMDGSQIANTIIKNEAMDRKLHVLAIARRLHYCLRA